MTCLIKSKNKPLLDLYTSMLGSEQAAYHVLCKNNGYPLEFTPFGEKSDLFQQLLTKNNYDYEAAIREKAEFYYSSYYDEIGGDWTMTTLDGSVIDSKGEPKISYKPESIDFSDVFSQPISLDETDTMSLPEIQENLILNDLNNFLKSEKPVSISERHNKTVEWLADKLKKLVDSIDKSLINAFGLEKKVDKDGNVTFVSKEKDESGRYKVIIQFCEYIENGKLGVYDQTGRLEAAANVIQISLLDGNPTTINHELTHHYIRMFWDSEVIQNAAKKLDSGDRSEGWLVRLEEKLVDEITKRTTEVDGFWNNFGEMIKTAFLWISSPIKQNLLRKASLTFRLNKTATRIRNNLYILSFIDPTAKRVFMSSSNAYIIEFDRIKETLNLEQAIERFIQDSESFWRTEISSPNSIARGEYYEYLQHVKNELCSTTVSDNTFNTIYIRIQDERSRRVTSTTSPTSVEYIFTSSILLMIEEARLIRENLRSSSTSGVSQQNSGINVNLNDLVSKIIKSLNTRIYEYLHTVPKAAKSANEIQELVDKIHALSDNKDQLLLFIQYGTEELIRLYNRLEELSRNDFSDLNTLLLYSLWNTIDGFYDPIINIIYKELGGTKKNIILGGLLSGLGVKLSQMTVLCEDIRSSLKDANTIISKRETHEFLVGDGTSEDNGVISDLLTDEQKERFLENFDDQLIIGKLFEDINMLQPYIGLASRSKSIVIRVARNMILSANSEIRKATLKDASKIIKLYFRALPELRKLGLREIQSIFLEMDENGLPTGYFVRRVNYGKFYKDLDLYRTNLIDETNEKLKTALGNNAPQITYDVYNNPILPPDDDPTVKTILQEYSDELDEWLCDNSERMFIPDYYRIRRTKLSPHTRRVMLDIQNRIQSIMSKAPITEITDSSGNKHTIQATWELSPDDLLNLVLLRMEYKQLGNLYYSDGTKKTGEEFDVAKEISDFNEWKSKLVDYVQNEKRFNAAIENIRSKYGLNSLEESRFRKLNTSIKVNPKYYDFVLSRVHFPSSPELDALRKRRNDLKKLIDEFDRKGIDVEQKRRQQEYWNSLKEVDSQIAELLGQLGTNQKVPEEEKWSTYFDKEFVMYDDNETLLDHMLKQDMIEYRRTHPADTRSDDELREELITKYQYTYEYEDESGESHTAVGLISIFTRWVPRGASINDANKGNPDAMHGNWARNALIVEYSQLFSDVDPNSQLYNPNFDRNDTHLVQPKTDLYENSKLWNIIKNNQKIKDLYDALIDLMNRNNAKLPTNADFNYKLPQITARRLTILRRSGSLKELGDALKYNFEMDWKLNERDDADTNYEDQDLKLRANGTRINTVPVRYTKTLDRPEFITSDVIGSIIAFTEMANNFVVKTQLASELEIIKQQLSDRENPGLARSEGRLSTENIIKQLSNMMDDLLYGNNTKYGSKNSEFSKKELFLIKFMTRFLHFGRILMLGWNFTSMSVGFFESYIRGNLEAFLGKDYTFRDLMHGYAHMARYALPTFGQVGSVKVKNKQIALMLWFGLSKRLTESYRGTERRRLLKVLNENLDGMFGFTLGDYANSSFQLAMALSNVRFINNGLVDTGFYTKQTLIKAVLKKYNMSYKDAKALAIAAYKESDICLEDAYDFENGELSVKPEYAQYVNSKLENRVTGKCYLRLAEALGIVPQNDNPGYGLLILLRPLGVLRNYLFTVIARNWNWSHDLQYRYLDEKNNIVKEDDMADGYIDIDAGNMNIGLHLGLIGWMKMMSQKLHIIEKTSHLFDDETKEIYNYAAAKVCLEVLSIVSLVGISTLFKALAKGSDDKDWFYRFGYLTSVRLVNSFIAVLDPTSFLEVIKNISTLISPLNDLIRCITILSDSLGLSGHSPFDEIQSGSYKGRSRLFRNLMRITPLGNAYEDLSVSALKSRANWYLQQDPITWSAIGGVYDQLWDSGN